MAPPGRDLVSADLSKDPEIVRAVASFFRDDADRILAIASRLGEGGRSVESTVRGRSMGETLPEGMRIRIQLSRQPQYRVGDVVAFLSGTTVVVHRVAYCGRRRSRDGYMVTIGDAKLLPDPPVDGASVLGLVTGRWCDGAWAPIPGKPLQTDKRAAGARAASLLTAITMEVSPRLAAALVIGLYRGPVRLLSWAHRRSRSA